LIILFSERFKNFPRLLYKKSLCQFKDIGILLFVFKLLIKRLFSSYLWIDQFKALKAKFKYFIPNQ